MSLVENRSSRGLAPWRVLAGCTVVSLGLILFLRPWAQAGRAVGPPRDAAAQVGDRHRLEAPLPPPPKAPPARRAAPGPPTRRSVGEAPLPDWLLASLGRSARDDAEGLDAASVVTNLALSLGGESFDPDDLRVLQDLIDRNGLDEASSSSDHDDGDGLLEPWEVGFQAWSEGRLVALAFGPDRYSSFHYRIEALPESIGSLGALRYLDVHGESLAELPAGLGDLSELRELYAFDNLLVGLPEELGSLRELRVLAVSENEIAALPDRIGELSALERLYIGGNPLDELSLGVAELGALRLLNIAGTRAGDGSGVGHANLPAILEPLLKLDTLYLTRAEAGAWPPEILRDGTISHVYGMAPTSR